MTSWEISLLVRTRIDCIVSLLRKFKASSWDFERQVITSWSQILGYLCCFERWTYRPWLSRKQNDIFLLQVTVVLGDSKSVSCRRIFKSFKGRLAMDCEWHLENTWRRCGPAWKGRRLREASGWQFQSKRLRSLIFCKCTLATFLLPLLMESVL